MTEVICYENVGSEYVFIENLLRNKVVNSGQRAIVFLASKAAATDLDRFLWTHTKESFIPHCMADNELASLTPIVLVANGEQLPEADDILINCSSTYYQDFASFNRLVEISVASIAENTALTTRISEYKSRGHYIRTIDITKYRNRRTN